MVHASEPTLPETSRSATAAPSIYLGLFLITAATLAYQVLLTRIFSVTLWYHFAFLAISISMLGMSVGAILVYLAPARFVAVERSLPVWALVFSVSIAASFLVHLAVPVHTDGSLRAWATLSLTCVVIAVPFTASGVCVALALTRFPRQVNSLYATDLGGAAVGCLLVIGLLGVLDGPTAVFAVALVAASAAAAFAGRGVLRGQRGIAWALSLALAVFVVGHGWLAHRQAPWLRIMWTKTDGGPRATSAPLYERWNSHSRVRVWGDPARPEAPFGWTFSGRMPKGLERRQLHMDIDSSAYTVLTEFDGALGPLEYLRYDVTNLAHHLRSSGDVLVIGAGGGRDVLSALVFGQDSVVAVEVNAAILDVVNRVYGDFTGHLDRHPRVRFVNDEARSFVSRTDERFDVIQISLIDSWAATGAGAFVLTEHGLYTTEAWQLFLERLRPGGLLTVTRYYFPGRPATAIRAAAMAARALERIGVDSPRDHIAIVARDPSRHSNFTLLVGASPLSAEDLARLGEVARRLDFSVLLGPKQAALGDLARVADGGDLEDFFASYPLDVSPPTDDRPFFFHMLRFRDLLDGDRFEDQGLARFNLRAVGVLGGLLVIVSILTLLGIVVPLAVRRPIGRLRPILPWLGIFAGIGVGFMMVEISQMERLIVFLGHPVYALSVVLFALLTASGAGSLVLGRVAPDRAGRATAIRAGLLLGALVLFGLLTPAVTAALRSAETPVRVLAAVVLLAPIGFFMGAPFPVAMAVAAEHREVRELTPWLWGINGATSVVASVLAIVVALAAGITVSFWTGVACYGLAMACLVHVTRSP